LPTQGLARDIPASVQPQPRRSQCRARPTPSAPWSIACPNKNCAALVVELLTHGNGSADPKLAERRASANAARGRQAGPARAIKANGTGHGNGSTSVSAKRLWRRRKARTR